MKKPLSRSGTAAGIVGTLVCAVAGITRLSGGFYLAGYELGTLLNAGLALLIFGCYLKLESLSVR